MCRDDDGEFVRYVEKEAAPRGLRCRRFLLLEVGKLALQCGSKWLSDIQCCFKKAPLRITYMQQHNESRLLI